MSKAFCKHCVDVQELPGKPAGKETKYGGVNAYVASGSKKGTIVVATDIFGLAIDNPMIVADRFAKETGYSVVVPDLFNGEPISPNDFKLPKHKDDPQPEGADKNFDIFGAWLGKGNKPDETYPKFKKVVDQAAQEGAVAAIGYCYGGKLMSLTAQDGAVKGVVINHPAMLEKGEAASVKVPTLINASEVDPIFTDDVKQDWFDTLKSAGHLDPASTTYKNAVHGHAIRPDLNKPDIKKAYEDSFAKSVAFFQRVLG